MRWSICATRAVIIWSASRPIVIDPSSTCATNSLIRPLPRSRAAGSPNRPCSTIWSRRLDSPAACSTTAAPPATFWVSGIGFSLPDFGLEFVKLIGLAHGFEQRIIQFLVGLQRTLQIIETRAQIQQFLQRLHLSGYLFRLEIFQALEAQVDLELAGTGIFAQLVFDCEGKVRLHAFQDGVEVIGCNLDKTPLFEFWQRLLGLACEIAKDSNHEGQFLDFNCAPGFDVVGNLNA